MSTALNIAARLSSGEGGEDDIAEEATKEGWKKEVGSSGRAIPAWGHTKLSY